MEYGGYRTVKTSVSDKGGEQVKCSGIRIDDTIINTDEDGVGRSFENRFGPFLRAGCLFTKSVAANRVTDTCGKHFVLVSSLLFLHIVCHASTDCLTGNLLGATSSKENKREIGGIQRG